MTAPDLVVEADIGSATTRGRRPDHHWLVRLRRGHHAVVIDHGLTKNQADRLATRLAELINDTTP
jgi:hypothetical protein